MPAHELCARLQNGARARLRSIPLPSTKAAQNMTSILLAHGFIHSVVRGTLAGPSPTDWQNAGIAHRRLWVDLKYAADERPVLTQLNVVSKPSKRIRLNAEELLRLSTGRRAQFVPPLGLGEIAIVDCGANQGWCEAREAIARGIGGELVARAS